MFNVIGHESRGNDAGCVQVSGLIFCRKQIEERLEHVGKKVVLHSRPVHQGFEPLHFLRSPELLPGPDTFLLAGLGTEEQEGNGAVALYDAAFFKFFQRLVKAVIILKGLVQIIFCPGRKEEMVVSVRILFAVQIHALHKVRIVIIQVA